MPVAPDAQSLTTAAEQAAGNGDFSTAAHYLTLAADLQAAGAGSMPVELANTLNNLGVVYERLDRAADAERCYRRAHARAGSWRADLRSAGGAVLHEERFSIVP